VAFATAGTEELVLYRFKIDKFGSNVIIKRTIYYLTKKTKHSVSPIYAFRDMHFYRFRTMTVYSVRFTTQPLFFGHPSRFHSSISSS